MPSPAEVIAALRGQPQDPMPFGVGGPAEPAIASGAPGLVGGLASGAYGQVKNLIDAAGQAPQPGLRREDYTDVLGNAQPSDPLTHSAAQMAISLAGVGAPAAEAGAAGIFGGKLAKTANLDKLAQAQSMVEKGMDRGIIRQITGWHQMPDQDWRFHIPSTGSRMLYPEASGPASHLYQHDELYKAYPGLQNIKMSSEINPNFPTDRGMWSLRHGTLDLSSRTPEMARAGAEHEFTHSIQDIEGHAPGSTPDIYQMMIDKFPERMNQHYPGLTAYDLYHRTAGEVEARNAEVWRNFDKDKAFHTHPWDTQDVPYEQQYVLPPNTGPLFETVLNALRGKSK